MHLSQSPVHVQMLMSLAIKLTEPAGHELMQVSLTLMYPTLHYRQFRMSYSQVLQLLSQGVH